MCRGCINKHLNSHTQTAGPGTTKYRSQINICSVRESNPHHTVRQQPLRQPYRLCISDYSFMVAGLKVNSKVEPTPVGNVLLSVEPLLKLLLLLFLL